MINFVYEQHSRRITTGVLNDVLVEATTKVQPPTDKGKRLKLLYMTQVSIKPPTFVIFVNDAELFHFSYQRYIENQMRETFGLTGTPINIIVRQKTRDKD
jgi:GTP-binding protein